MSNVVGFLVFLILSVFGGLLGSVFGGESGAQVGFVAFGLFALLVPYRRWILRWWMEWQRRE